MANVDLENEHLRLQIAEKRLSLQKRGRDGLLEWLKVGVTAAGTAVIVVSLLNSARGIQRQHAWEQATAAKTIRIQRMSAIVTEFETLYARISAALDRHNARVHLLGKSFGALRDRINLAHLPAKEKSELLDHLDQIIGKLPSQETTLTFDAYVEGSELFQAWNAREHAFTPDTRLYFGADVQSRWAPVYSNGHIAMLMRFPEWRITVSATSQIKTFRQVASEYDAAMRARLEKEIQTAVSER